MAIKKITINNIMLENQRKSPLYQAVIVDLKNAGVIPADVAAGLLGEEVPDYLKLPRGYSVASQAKKAPETKDLKKKLEAIEE